MATKARTAKSRGAKAKAMTKAQMAAEVSAKTGLSKAQVNDVFQAMGEVVGGELKAGRPVAVPGLVKITIAHKAATPARTMPSPFVKGETIHVKAKPARKVVRVRALKGLKDMV